MIAMIIALISCATAVPDTELIDPKPWKDLSAEETRIIEYAGTEMPGSGQFLKSLGFCLLQALSGRLSIIGTWAQG